MPDDVVGFNRQDADALLREIGNNGGEVRLFTHPEAVGADGRHYRFTLTSDMSTGTGTADILEMDGSTSVETGATIKVGFSGLTAMLSGDGGLCFKQDGTYYIENGNCPGDGA